MLEYLDMLSDPGRADWHFNQGEIILLAHKHKKRAKDYKTKDDDTKWKAFTDVVGKPRITWPSPPDPIGWTFDQMYPWWDGKEENIPDHMMQVLLPKYMMGCAHMPKP
jgi:hypothetical protein